MEIDKKYWNEFSINLNLEEIFNFNISTYYFFRYLKWNKAKNLSEEDPLLTQCKYIMDFKMDKHKIEQGNKLNAIKLFKNALLLNEYNDVDCFVVPAPSKIETSKDFDDRFKILLKNFQNVIYLQAKKNVHSSHNYPIRKTSTEVYKNILDNNSINTKIKNIVFIDDVYTLGNTLKGTLQYLNKIFPNLENVTALFLAKTDY